MKKAGIYILILVITPIVAGAYGALHDQVTYSISNEYFTRFKYEQFGFEPGWFGGHRPTVAVIGFLATWWTGILIGFVLASVAIFFNDYKSMWRYCWKAIAITLCVAILAGFAGFLYGKFHLTKTGVNWWLPENLIDKNSFIVVGSIHNFSYLGGLLGLITSLIFMLRWKISQRAPSSIQQPPSSGRL